MTRRGGQSQDPRHRPPARRRRRRRSSPPSSRAYGRLDILVNNAGTTKRGDFLAQPDADWQEGFALKFFAHVRLARAAWPLLRESNGSLVIIGGTAGKQPTANSIVGASVNGAINSFAQALAQLGNEAAVQVNVVSPGHVDTDRLQRRIDVLKQELGLDEAGARERYRQNLGVNRLGLPQDVADLVAFIASPHGRWLHGVDRRPAWRPASADLSRVTRRRHRRR